MPGFFSIIDYNYSNKTLHKTSSFKENIKYKSKTFVVNIYSDTIDKFKADKLFYQDDELIIVLEGVIFNKKELLVKLNLQDWVEAVKHFYKSNGNAFHLIFRGSYSGFIYDKQKERWNIFTDPIGDKQVFVFKNRDNILFGSEIKYFLSFFEVNNISVSLDVTAAYMLLSYGFFLEDYTLFKEIRKLKAGYFISIKNKRLEFLQYHQFSNHPNIYLKNENEIIGEIDSRFRTAVKRQFDKDVEYGYKHIAGLSGGLDSRMTTWVAHDMGYDAILNFTFSQSDYLDETIAKKIARDLNHEWLFKALDNGNFLKEQFESVIDISYGGALYYGLAHFKSFIDLCDLSQYGILHSGQLGDVVIGSFYKKVDQIKDPVSFKKGAYSVRLINRIEKQLVEISDAYENTELFQFYTRCFTGANQGLLVSQQHTETFSPFYDLDLLEFCLHIPAEYRIGHYIYKKWIKSKYPKAAKYIWEKIGTRILSPTVRIKGKEYYIPQIRKALKNRLLKPVLGDKVSITNSKNHMNPLDYWYRMNPELQIFMNDYYEDNIGLFDKYPILKKDMKNLYNQGNTVEKNQVLTLIGAVTKFLT